MIRRVLKLTSAIIVVGVFSAAGTAVALPVANVTGAPLVPVEVGQVVTFDGSQSICDFPPCRYIWSWFYPSGITGGQMGEGPIIDYAFPSTAAGRTVAVVVKVVDNTKTHGFSTTTVRVVVMPLDPAAEIPPAADPPAADPPAADPPVDPVADVPVADVPVADVPVADVPVADPGAVDPPVVTPPQTPRLPNGTPIRHGGRGKRGG